VLGRFASMTGRIRFSIIISKIMDNNGRRFMDLYELGESGSLTGLRIMIITENVYKTGKYASLRSHTICICIRMLALAKFF